MSASPLATNPATQEAVQKLVERSPLAKFLPAAIITPLLFAYVPQIAEFLWKIITSPFHRKKENVHTPTVIEKLTALENTVQKQTQEIQALRNTVKTLNKPVVVNKKPTFASTAYFTKPSV